MTSLTDELIDGIDLKIGRRVLTVPPLNFKLLRKFRPQVKLLSEADPAQTDMPDTLFDALIDIVHAAVLRNYPNISRDEIEDGLDVGNAPRILTAVLKGSGLASQGEARPGKTAT